MKILCLADEESPSLWEHYSPGSLRDYELILSAGDLKAQYLSFLVTMSRCPLLYVHGNHDESYSRFPPEGCDCIDGKLLVYRGLRILGLGGCLRYRDGEHQYTEGQMRRRIRRMRRAVKAVGGVDIVLSHAAPRGMGDWDDRAHRGFESFAEFIEKHRPAWLLHGHVHLNYGHDIKREHVHGETRIVNCCGKHVIEHEGSFSVSG